MPNHRSPWDVKDMAAPEFSKAECSICYKILPKPSMERRTITNRSGYSDTPNRIYFNKAGMQVAPGRTEYHYSESEVWICFDCKNKEQYKIKKSNESLFSTLFYFGVIAVLLLVFAIWSAGGVKVQPTVVVPSAGPHSAPPAPTSSASSPAPSLRVPSSASDGDLSEPTLRPLQIPQSNQYPVTPRTDNTIPSRNRYPVGGERMPDFSDHNRNSR